MRTSRVLPRGARKATKRGFSKRFRSHLSHANARRRRVDASTSDASCVHCHCGHGAATRARHSKEDKPTTRAPAIMLRRSSSRGAAETWTSSSVPICVELLYEPYTGPCGHSFCRRCAGEARRRDPRCPTCRASWRGVPANLPVSSALATAIRRLAPAEYAARAAEAPPFEPVAERTIGVFQLYHVLPQQRLQLHIFEPRYRGLVARALQREPRTFAMAGPGAQVLCEVEITSHDQSRDGRYYIEVVGRRRLRCERDWQDNSNLRVAVVSELTDDAILPQQEATLAAAAALTAASIALIRVTFQRTGRLDMGTMEVLGADPPADFEALGLWSAALVNELPPPAGCARHPVARAPRDR